MSETRNTDYRNASAWFQVTPEVEGCFREILALAVEQGWRCEVTSAGIEVRRPGAKPRFTVITVRALQEAPRRTLESFRELGARETSAAHTRDDTQDDGTRPASGRGVVVGSAAVEYSPFNGSHISERSG